MPMKTCVLRPATIRPLSKDEIERRIDSLSTEMTESVSEEAPEELGGGHPRRISASELVRQMRPFLVLN